MIWINCYEIVKFLRMNQSETVKVEGDERVDGESII